MPDDQSDLLDRYRMYHEEDRHECGLLSARVNGLITSQTIFAAVAAVIYQTKGNLVPGLLILLCISTLACVIAYLACVAIVIGILVLRAWHELGGILEKEDTQHRLNGYHLDREQPDRLHT